ncbi:MAG: hypothetical protein MRZ79_20390 [Bacteroidia bacterium]|nr:hypothetical protein [Bacteroidia bacterium]
MTHLKRIFLLLVLSVGLVACGPEISNPEIQPLTEKEAVSILDAEMQAVSGGITTNVENLVKELVSVILSGKLCDTTITDNMYSDYQGTFLQTKFESDYSFYMTCGFLNIPQSAAILSSTKFLLTTSEMRLDNTSTFAATATGVSSGPLQLVSDTIVVNGDYEKLGILEVNFNTPKVLNSTFEANLIDFKVGIFSQQIEAGTLEFEFHGSSTQYGNFSYPGTITYHGNKTATLTINNTNYPLDWN